MTKKIQTQLDRIAIETFIPLEDRANLESTNSGADFVEVSTWAIRKALEQAYKAGREQGMEEVKFAAEL